MARKRKRKRFGKSGRKTSSAAAAKAGTREETKPGAPEGRKRGSRPARRWLFRLGAVALGLVVALVCVELGLRATGTGATRLRSKRMLNNLDTSYYFHCYTSNPNGELEPVPDVSQGHWVLKTTMLPPTELPLEKISETPFCVRYDNTLLPIDGEPVVVRDRQYQPDPPPDTKRILLIGDSFAYGEGVPLERTLFRQLERELEGRFQVINAARPGFDTALELHRASRLVPVLNAKRMLVIFIANDILLTDELIQRQNFINDLINVRDEHLARHEDQSWYRDSLRVVEFFGSAWEMRRIAQQTIRWYLDSYDPQYNEINLRRLEHHIGQFGQWSDCQVAFVLYPLMEGLRGDYPLQPIHDRVAQMVRKAGLPVLDLAPAFAGKHAKSLWVHPADHHPCGKAHRTAAREIARWLVTEEPSFLEGP